MRDKDKKRTRECEFPTISIIKIIQEWKVSRKTWKSAVNIFV